MDHRNRVAEICENSAHLHVTRNQFPIVINANVYLAVRIKPFQYSGRSGTGGYAHRLAPELPHLRDGLGSVFQQQPQRGIRVHVGEGVLLEPSFSSRLKFTCVFKPRTTLFMVKTSERTGTFLSVVFPSLANIVAASSGSTAFLAPSILTVPTRRLFPP